VTPASAITVAGAGGRKPTESTQLAPPLGRPYGPALALSHLDVDASGGDGFVLYANYKQADVAEETHGSNIYGEPPGDVTEHYAGMIVEPINYGLLLRYERRHGQDSVRCFRRPYDPGATSLGHTWLPINMELDSTRERLFCTFNGFHPRLATRHVAAAYPDLAVEPATIGRPGVSQKSRLGVARCPDRKPADRARLAPRGARRATR
jgi:hypothetical protein